MNKIGIILYEWLVVLFYFKKDDKKTMEPRPLSSLNPTLFLHLIQNL